MEPLQPIKWWGYKHTNGSLHVKRFFSYEDISEARTSPFVLEVVGPFAATNREAAEAQLLLKRG